MTTERRLFNRISFDAAAQLISQDQEVSCSIIDLSLHGALVTLEGSAETEGRHLANQILAGNPLILRIPLDQEANKIEMQVALARQDGDKVGLTCLHIDLQSIMHLRRIVELNLGDASALDREFTALCQ